MDSNIPIKTPAMQLIEAERGRSIEEVFRELYVDRGLTQREIAAELDIDEGNVSRWMDRLGIAKRRLRRRRASAASLAETV